MRRASGPVLMSRAAFVRLVGGRDCALQDQLATEHNLLTEVEIHLTHGSFHSSLSLIAY